MKYKVTHEVSAYVTPWRIFCAGAVIYLAGIATALIALTSN